MDKGKKTIGRPSSSGYQGVYYRRGLWAAVVYIDGKAHQLGLRSSAAAAALLRAEYLNDQAQVAKIRGDLDIPYKESRRISDAEMRAVPSNWKPLC